MFSEKGKRIQETGRSTQPWLEKQDQISREANFMWPFHLNDFLKPENVKEKKKEREIWERPYVHQVRKQG